MFRSYIKTAVQNLMRAKVFTAINITGFAIGICAVIFMLHYIQFNLGYDKYHEKGDRIFRVSVIHATKWAADNDSHLYLSTIGEAMKKEFREVENFVRLQAPRPVSLMYSNKSYFIENVTYTDTSYFNIFSSKLLAGNRFTCLSTPNQIVLSKSTADKIFGGKNPIGEVVRNDNNEELTVSGIMEDSPENSDLRFGGIVSFSTLDKVKDNGFGWNGGNRFITYVLLKNSDLKQSVEAKFPSFMWEHINKEYSGLGVKDIPYLQPLNDIHTEYNEESKGLKTNIYMLSALALFILALACINFVNLFMSRAIKRNKEIGIRKILGASRKDIFFQFMSESLVLIIISTFIAILLCAAAMPFYNMFTRQDSSFAGIINIQLLSSTGLAILFVCFLSSFYPSLVLSSFQPAQIMNKSVLNKPGKLSLKGALVIFQFAISIALIICTFLISSQLDYMKTKDLGFDKENQVYIQLSNAKMQTSCENIKAEIMKIGGVTGVSASSDVPGWGTSRNGYTPEDLNNSVMINFLDVDADFLKTYNIPLAAGRNFIAGSQADKESYLVNEAFVKKMNWSNPIGKEVRRGGVHRIIGVVKDFNFETLHDKIKPLIISNSQESSQYHRMVVNTKSSNIESVAASIEKVCGSFTGGQPVFMNYFDDAINSSYWREETFMALFGFFSMIAIMIAVLGILGLTLFAVEQKKKEIAIRKVLGASVKHISVLVSKQFTLWILLSNLIAWPAAYYFIRGWLSKFAYKADILLIYFIQAAVIALLIAWAIICYHTIKAAINNPVESLKYE